MIQSDDLVVLSAYSGRLKADEVGKMWQACLDDGWTVQELDAAYIRRFSSRPMKRYERGGRWVEVSGLKEAWYGDNPCWLVNGRGDRSLYFDGTETILALDERPDGWTAYYQEEDFMAYALGLIRLRGNAGMRGWGE